MNNYPNKLNVAKAVKHRSTFPLSFQHQTTQDFGKTTILHACEVMPGDEFDINVSAKAQLAPLVLPTMSNVNLYVRAFFVPFRFVWSDWEDFFTQKLVNKNGTALTNHVPFISSYILWNVFKRTTGSNPFVTAYTGEKPDFYTVLSDGETTTDTKYQLTYHGRLAKQILEGLGYVINPCVDPTKQEDFSALPLLSLVKIFRDYYVNPNYDYTTIDRILSREYTSAFSTDSNYQFLKDSELLACINFVMFGWFESDIFTSAWINPEGPQYSQIYSNPNVPGGTYTTSSVRVESISPAQGSDPTTLRNYTNGSLSTMSGVTQYGLNVLKAVRNFVLRRNVSGARYIDQLLSRFGISLEPNEARRAMFLGSFESSAVIGRVDATSSGVDASGNSSSLGDYTGRGIIDNNGHFHFKNDKNDFGMLIFVSHLMPRTAYYQGVKPHLNHLYFNDFFNPDLEDVGTAPLPNNVLFDRYVSNVVRDSDYDAGFQRGVFGFVPNYFEYKSQLDYLTGDFAVNHLNSELKSFELMRKFRSPNSGSIAQYYEDDEGLKPQIGEPVQKADKDSVAPYSRMFLTQSQDADHFVMSYYFDIRATRNCNSLGNSILAELNEHGNDVGDVIKVRPNGKYF